LSAPGPRRKDARRTAPAVPGRTRHRIGPHRQHRVPRPGDHRCPGSRDRHRVEDPQALVWHRLALATLEGAPQKRPATFAILDSRRQAHVIVFFNPRATRPKNRRYPLSILALAAMIEGKQDYAIVDGNLDADPQAAIDRIMRERPARV